MTPPSLTVLVVGGGSMGAMHVRVLHALDSVDSVVLVEPERERRERLLRSHPRLVAHTDLAAALQEEPLDAACVAVPAPAAPEVAIEVIDAGLPLLLEKPMAPTVEEASSLAERARGAGVLLSVGYVERFNPAVQALKAELDRGTGGEVLHLHARRLSPFPQRKGLAGVAIDLATHDLDVAGFLIGSLPVRVFAETADLGASLGEDLLCASIRYANGVTGLLEANWHTPSKVRELSVTTTGGMFVVSYLTQDLSYHEGPDAVSEWETLGVMKGANEGRMIRFGLERREPLAVEWERFLEAVATGGPAPVPAEDGIAALQAARAIVEAGVTHRPVAMEHA